MTYLVGIMFLIGFVIGFICRPNYCKHEWDEVGVEYTDDFRFGIKYKVHTLRCKQCGKIKIQKFKIN